MDKQSAPIGIFDSGLGGLCAVAEFIKRLPHENMVYFGDTARVPYGTRSEEIVVRYAEQDMAFLMTKKVKAVVVACGTVSSTALPVLKKKYDVPIFDVIAPSVRAALKASRNHRIAVIGTSVSIQSGAYQKALLDSDENISVTAAACPLFIPLVENGFIEPDNEVTTLVARQYLKPIAESGADTLILGCTHFPLIRSIIARVLPGVHLIDTGAEAIAALAEFLKEYHMENASSGVGKREFFVSDKPQNFSAMASSMLGGHEYIDAEKVETDAFSD